MLRMTYSKDVSAQVRLLAHDGRRVLSGQQLSDAARVCDSGPYRPCFTYALARGVEPGAYTVLASTFRPGQAFPLILEAAASPEGGDVSLAQLPEEGAGMRKMVRPGVWRLSDGSAAGCANHGKYERNPMYSLHVPAGGALVWVKMVARPAGGSASVGSSTAGGSRGGVTGGEGSKWPALNVSVFRAPEQVLGHVGEISPGSLKIGKAVSTSCEGVYLGTPHGVVTRPVRLDEGMYLLIGSTFDPWDGRFTLRCYSDRDVVLEPR